METHLKNSPVDKCQMMAIKEISFLKEKLTKIEPTGPTHVGMFDRRDG